MKSEIRPCKVCGASFKFYSAYAKRGPKHGLYCSKKCRGIDRGGRETVNCAACSKEFSAKRNVLKQGYANYCSKSCWAETRKNGSYSDCIICNKQIYRTPFHIKTGLKVFCSQECRATARRGLNGKRANFRAWQRRDWLSDSCNGCGAKLKLQLDHIIPRFAGGISTKENAQTLCSKCNRDKYWKQDLPYYSWLKANAQLDVGKFSLIDLDTRKRATGRKRKQRERLSERTP